MTYSNEVNWDAAVWKEINDAVVMEVGKVRTAQKTLSTVSFTTCPPSIANETIDFAAECLSIKEGQTKSFVELSVPFCLTETQICHERELKTAKTLARMAAKALALAEDGVIFQGSSLKLPANVHAKLLDSSGTGLLGEANPTDASDSDPNKVSVPITVPRVTGDRPGILFGENLFSAVVQGIAKLTAKAQAPPFALFLPPTVFADAHVPAAPASYVTAAQQLASMLEGGLVETVNLPADRGLLVALAGDPTMLYLGSEAMTKYVCKQGTTHELNVTERIQFVSRDPRALVLLKFEPPPSPGRSRS